MSIIGGVVKAAAGALGGIVGNKMNNEAAKDAANKAWERQKTSMQNQIQWKVSDAVKAGLHPLAALGVNPASGPPVAQIDGSLGSTLSQAGSDLGSAIDRGLSPEDKTQTAITRLQLERAGLENELLRTQITSQRVRTVRDSTQVAGTRFAHPDGSLKAGDNGMGSKAVLDGVSSPFIVGQPGSAQQMADNYGDWAQELYGLGRFATDIYNNYGPDVAQWFGDIVKRGPDNMGLSPDWGHYWDKGRR